MIVNEKHPLFKKVKLVDVNGNEVPFVASFNTQNYETHLYVSTGMDEKGRPTFLVQSAFGTGQLKKLALARVKLYGAYLIWKDTGIRVTKDAYKDLGS